jgi:hypothetical protein
MVGRNQPQPLAPDQVAQKAARQQRVDIVLLVKAAIMGVVEG